MKSISNIRITFIVCDCIVKTEQKWKKVLKSVIGSSVADRLQNLKGKVDTQKLTYY